MDNYFFDRRLEETGFGAMTSTVTPAGGAVLSDNAAEPWFVAELDLDDPEDADETTGAFTDVGKPGDRLENAELVAAAFRAAGDPKFQDVKLKSARGGNCPVPTYREVALQRAKRINASVAW